MLRDQRDTIIVESQPKVTTKEPSKFDYYKVKQNYFECDVDGQKMRFKCPNVIGVPAGSSPPADQEIVEKINNYVAG